jgi:hypothetical protein
MATADESQERLVLRQQAWFRPSMAADALQPFPKRDLNRALLQEANPWYLRQVLGKGPYQLTGCGSVVLKYDSSDCPAFDCPGYTSGQATPDIRKEPPVFVDKDSPLFMLEVGCVHLADCSTEEAFKRHSDLLAEARERLELLVGVYSLYQYPLVWHPLGSWSDVARVNLATMEGVRNTQYESFIAPPVFVSLSDAEVDRRFISPVGRVADALFQTDLRLPLLFLQKALWQDEPQARFLHEFWILEYFSWKRGAHRRPDAAIREFVQRLEGLVEHNLPSDLELFKQRKGRLLQPTLREAFRAYAQSRGITFDERLFAKAKKMRDALSHGRAFDRTELPQTQIQISQIVRSVLRAELSTRNISLPIEQE